MKNILILYFSGAGATKKIAGLICSCLSQKCKADIFSIENNADFDMTDYDAFIKGTPVYHAAPSYAVTNFFNSIRPLNKATPVYGIIALFPFINSN